MVREMQDVLRKYTPTSFPKRNARESTTHSICIPCAKGKLGLFRTGVTLTTSVQLIYNSVFNMIFSFLHDIERNALCYRGNVAKNNKTRVFYVLYSDKTWVFDQSERAQGPIYIINLHNLGVPQDVFQVL